MEKSVKIGERLVSFKATGGIGYRYKAQFGREFLADVKELEDFTNSARTVQKTKTREDGKLMVEKVTEYDFAKFSLEAMYNLIWTLAKTADEAIPDPQEWLDSFDTFPVMDIYGQVQSILTDNFKVDPKNV